MSKITTRPVWYRKKRFLFVSLLILLVILGLAVGLGVGLSRRGATTTTTSAESSPTPTGSTTTNPTNRSLSIWQPAVGSTWQIVLLYALNDTSPNVAVYDIDLFTNPSETIAKLHALGRRVICYMSAGSYEDFRPDSNSFKSTDYGKPLRGWPGEFWLNTKSQNVRNVMMARMDLAVKKGCDGIDPDNIDGFENDTGFDLSMADAIDYLTFLADAAHSRNLSIGLKNGGSIASQVLPMMQWEINEECIEQKQCAPFQAFINAGKPVFHIEYPPSAPSINAQMQNDLCTDPSAAGFSTVLKQMALNNWMQEC